jgi:hypothetical protein
VCCVVRMAKRSVSPNWKAIDPLGTQTGNASAEPVACQLTTAGMLSRCQERLSFWNPDTAGRRPSLTHERETPPATPLTGLRLACHGSVRWPFATGNGSTRLGMAFLTQQKQGLPSCSAVSGVWNS